MICTPCQKTPHTSTDCSQPISCSCQHRMIEVELPEEPITFRAQEHTGTNTISLIVAGEQSDTITLGEPADHKAAGAD